MFTRKVVGQSLKVHENNHMPIYDYTTTVIKCISKSKNKIGIQCNTPYFMVNLNW